MNYELSQLQRFIRDEARILSARLNIRQDADTEYRATHPDFPGLVFGGITRSDVRDRFTSYLINESLRD